RLLEHERIDGNRGDAAAGAPRRRNRTGDVDVRHDPAAENVAVEIRVGRHRHDAQDRLALRENAIVVHAVAAAFFRASSRNSRRRILPTFDFGSSLRNSTSRGHLYAVSFSRQYW